MKNSNMKKDQHLFAKGWKASWLGFSFAATMLLCFGTAEAQVTSTGSETIANTTTAGRQGNPDVATAEDGSYVIVWESLGTDGDDYGVYFQRYNSSGVAQGSETLVNSTTAGAQRFPSISMRADGQYVIAWQSDGQDGDGWGIYYARYNASGTQLQSETLANNTTAGNQMHPDVAMDYDGEFFIVWTSTGGQDGDLGGIYAERYNSSGGTATSEFNVNSNFTTYNQSHPAVAVDSTGNALFVWQSDSTDGGRIGVYQRAYNANGSAANAGSVVNTTTAGNQQEPDVAMGASSEALIVWASNDQDGDRYGIYGMLSSFGTQSGTEIQISTTTADVQNNPAVTGSWEGKFYVAWNSWSQDGNMDGVYTRGFNADGSEYDPEQRVNTRTTDSQQMPAVAVWDQDDPLVVAWMDGLRNSVATNDGDDYGVYFQRHTVNDVTPPTAVCQNITIFVDAGGNASTTAAAVDGGSTDNCGVVSLSLSQTNFTCADLGPNVETLTVTDAAGNTSTCNPMITVQDNIAPTAVCLGTLNVYLDGTGNATINASDLDGGSTDNCGSLTFTATQTSFTCADVGTFNVTMTATDGSGNTDNCVTSVTVLDTVSPAAVCQDITVYLDGTGNVTIADADIDGGSTDNCTGALTFSADITAFTCTEIGANTVTLTVTDPGGNSSNCTSTVTVLDTVSPVMVCQPYTVVLDGAGNGTLTTADIDGGSTDNCGAPTLSASQTSFTCADIGTVSVTLTGIDGSGNSSNCVATVTVQDNTNPTAVCSPFTVVLDGTGNGTLTAADIDGGSTDNCGGVTLAASQTAFTCADIGTVSVTLTVTDGSGNSSNCVATVTVQDNTPPTALCTPFTVVLDGAGNGTLTTADIDGGSTDNCGAPTLSASQTSFTCADIGTVSVTLTATDGSGNSSNCVATVTVQDNTAPTAVCAPFTVVLDGAGNGTLTAADIDGGSTDNCGSVTLAASQTAFTCADVGTVSVTLTVTDGSGNSSNCVATVTVQDNMAPTAVCQDITVYLDGAGNATITTGDIDNGSTDNCGVPTLSLDITSFTCADIGPNTVTLTATDAGSNTATCTATVTVVDSTAPAASCQDITVYLDGAGNATITTGDIDNGSSDNCGAPTLSLDITSFTCADVGPNTVTLTATDGSSNTSNCTATVTVVDSTAPTAVCQDITVYLDGAGNATITTGNIDNGSSDNCGAPTLSLDITSFTCADVGPNTVTLTATDGSSNTANCTATVTVVDSTAPTAACQDITVYLDGTGNATITTGDIDNGSADNCGVPTLSLDITSFTCADIGTNTVTLTATDAGSNTATCTATVTVVDSTAPAASCQDITVYLDGAGNATITTGDIDNGTTDNCSTPTLSLDITSFTCADVGANTVTLTATDASSNSSTCTATVTVVDSVSPTVSCQNITVYLDGGGNATITTGDIDAGSADNCGAPTLSLDISSFTCADLGPNTVTLTATDASSNTANCTATVTVIDSTAPTLTGCPADITLATNNAGCTGVPTWTPPTGADNCTFTLTSTHNSGDTFALGTTTVTYTITDGSGNVDSCSFDVTVTNDLAVTLASTDVLCNGDSTGTATSTVTGGTPPYTYAWSTGETGANENSLAAGTHTLTVTDSTGCTAMANVTITEPAAIAVAPVTTDVLCNGDSTGTAVLNTSGGTLPYTEDWGAADPNMLWAGTHVYTITDGNGCMYTDSVVINEPTGMIADTDSLDADCGSSNGQAWVTVTGGTPGYSYQWDAAAGSQTTDTAFNLAAGAYDVTITDGNGCTLVAQAIVINPNAPSLTTTNTNLACFGDSTGTADVTITGGLAPYSILWDNGDTTAVADSLGGGSLNVTVTDANGCVAITTVVIGEPPVITATSTITDVLCNGDSTGTAMVTPAGGTPGYTVDWGGANPGALPAGYHVFTVTDTNSCVLVDSVLVNEPSALGASVTTTNISCFGAGDGSAMVTPTGGTPGYIVDWGGADPNMLPPGITVFTVTDTNSCVYTDSVDIIEPGALSIITDSLISEMFGNDGAAYVTIAGGTAPYTYDWSNDGTGDFDDPEDLTGVVSGIYTLYVQDANGCMDSVDVFIDSEVGMRDFGNDIVFQVFPNPNTGEFQINMKGGSGKMFEVEIMDAAGRLIQDHAMPGNSTLQINMQTVERGMYFIRTTSGDYSTTHRVVIQR